MRRRARSAVSRAMLADEAKVGSRRWRAVVAALGAVPFFVDVAPEELEEIALQLTLCRYAKGERIVTEGEEADGFYQIVSGGAAVVVGGEVSARAKYLRCDVAQLKRCAEDAWLSAEGSADELVARLVDYEKPPSGWPQAEELLRYEPKGYFGELALLAPAPGRRNATVVATEKTQCVRLDVMDWQSLPCKMACLSLHTHRFSI